MLIEEIIFFVIVQVVTGFVVWIICNAETDNKMTEFDSKMLKEYQTKYKAEQNLIIICDKLNELEARLDEQEKVIQLESNNKKEQEVLNEKSKEEKENVKKQDKFFNEIMDYTYEKAKNVYKTE